MLITNSSYQVALNLSTCHTSSLCDNTTSAYVYDVHG